MTNPHFNNMQAARANVSGQSGNAKMQTRKVNILVNTPNHQETLAWALIQMASF